MSTLLADIRYAMRSLRKSPGLIAVAVISLGLGIGANVTIFSAVDVFMLRPLPYPDADRLLHVYSTVPARGWTFNAISIPDFLDLREQSETMDVAVSYGSDVNLSGGDRPERIEAERASWNYFQVLGVRPVIGRTFSPEEEQAGNHYVAVISHGLWTRRYGADPSVLGQTVELDGEAYTVVGVLQPDFRLYESDTELWMPLALTGEESRGSHFLSPVGRLHPGATVEQANQEASLIADRLAAAYPETNDGWGAGVRDLHRMIFSEEFRSGSLISFVAVAFVLLIACVNVANLMLTRVAGRGREIAVREALGAGRARIVRQLLTEAMMVSLLGGVVGVVLSVAGIRGLLSLMPPWFPRVDEIGLDARALLFALFATVLAGILFGIVPALHSSRTDLTNSLKEGSRGNVGARGDRVRRFLVVSEVSLALTLLVASVLLVKGFLRLQAADFGWDQEQVLTFRVDLPQTDYPDVEAVTEFYRTLPPRVAAIPGVESVGATMLLPMDGNTNTFYQIPGQEESDVGQRPLTEYRFVLPGYFETMRTPIIRGRALTDQDRVGSRPVVVVNEALVERHWPSEDAIGKQIEFWGETREIVGIIQNTRDVGPDPRPMTFLSALQYPRNAMSFVVRTAGAPSSVADQVRDVVAAIDPNLPLYQVRSLVEHIREEMAGNTIMAKIMAVLALVAFVLSVVGVYGVMAYSVSQRTQEMGIRMALGARQGNVLGMVIRQAAMLALIGVIVGSAIASLVTRSLSLFLFGVNPFDPTTFLGVATVLVLASLAASLVPARRATRVDPLEALRYE